jgi:F-type H+-transporting ATPase subunit delta
MSMTQSLTAHLSRYFNAYISLVKEQDHFEEAKSDFRALEEIIKIPLFQQFIRNPLSRKDEDWQMLEQILDIAKISGLTKKFIGVLFNNRRLRELHKIVEASPFEIATAQGIPIADITSAKPLTNDQLNELQQQLKKIAQQDVFIIRKVNPNLLGGMILKMGSSMFDTSLRTKLDKMHNYMKEMN